MNNIKYYLVFAVRELVHISGNILVMLVNICLINALFTVYKGRTKNDVLSNYFTRFIGDNYVKRLSAFHLVVKTGNNFNIKISIFNIFMSVENSLAIPLITPYFLRARNITQINGGMQHQHTFFTDKKNTKINS